MRGSLTESCAMYINNYTLLPTSPVPQKTTSKVYKITCVKYGVMGHLPSTEVAARVSPEICSVNFYSIEKWERNAATNYVLISSGTLLALVASNRHFLHVW